ncbi:MAG: glycosyl transferase [Rhizobacter sp.]|nr:glycosyl transferase [Rhizobacter sp.]
MDIGTRRLEYGTAGGAGLVATAGRALPALGWTWLVPSIASLFVVAWVVMSIHLSTAQWGDNFEQFAWAHSAEWGYHKHPPFPSWLLTAMTSLIGYRSWSAQALAGACILATGLFTHGIARRLLGSSAAALALLFWGLQQPFNARVTLYNHNTVMMLTVAATVWLVLRAVDSGHRTRWWAMAGLTAGAAMLSKYQSIVPLGGVVLALALGGDWRRPGVVKGLVTAVLTACVFCSPHVWWVAQHSFSTLDYASQHGQRLGAGERLASMVSFLAQQLRLLLPALVFAVVLVAMGRRALAVRAFAPALVASATIATSVESVESASTVAIADASAARRRVGAWLIGLIAFPLVVTVLMSPLFGLRLQNHWGYQALQFTSLFFASRWGGRVAGRQGTWLIAAVIVQAVFMTVIVATDGRPSTRMDAGYPAQELSDAVVRDWQQATFCPLRIVVGPSFEAGIVSIYHTGTAAVLEDGDWAKSPWIKPQDVSAQGAVYIAQDPADLPTIGVVDVGSLDVSKPQPAPRQRVYWAIVPPLVCDQNDE